MKILSQIQNCYFSFKRTLSRLIEAKCDHNSYNRFIVEVYLNDDVEWLYHDDEREVTQADLKCKCSNCGAMFLKRKNLIFRDSITKQYV